MLIVLTRYSQVGWVGASLQPTIPYNKKGPVSFLYPPILAKSLKLLNFSNIYLKSYITGSLQFPYHPNVKEIRFFKKIGFLNGTDIGAILHYSVNSKILKRSNGAQRRSNSDSDNKKDGHQLSCVPLSCQSP